MKGRASAVEVYGSLVLLVALAPVLAALKAWTAATVWRWFLAEQFGPGPSIGAWFGIMAIAWLVLHGVATQKPDKDQSPIAIVATHATAAVLVCFGTLATTWAFGAITGWSA